MAQQSLAKRKRIPPLALSCGVDGGSGGGPGDGLGSDLGCGSLGDSLGGARGSRVTPDDDDDDGNLENATAAASFSSSSSSHPTAAADATASAFAQGVGRLPPSAAGKCHEVAYGSSPGGASLGRGDCTPGKSRRV